jgi:cytochrome P450
MSSSTKRPSIDIDSLLLPTCIAILSILFLYRIPPLLITKCWSYFLRHYKKLSENDIISDSMENMLLRAGLFKKYRLRGGFLASREDRLDAYFKSTVPGNGLIKERLDGNVFITVVDLNVMKKLINSNNQLDLLFHSWNTPGKGLFISNKVQPTKSIFQSILSSKEFIHILDQNIQQAIPGLEEEMLKSQATFGGFSLTQEFSEWCLNVAISCVFGNKDRKSNQIISTLLRSLFDDNVIGGRSLFTFSTIGIMLWKFRHSQTRKLITSTILEMIRKRKKSNTTASDDEKDLLQLLLCLTTHQSSFMNDDELLCNVFISAIFILTEPTRRCIEWTLCLLVKHQQIEHDLRNELDKGKNTSTLEQLMASWKSDKSLLPAIILESWRLQPAIGILTLVPGDLSSLEGIIPSSLLLADVHIRFDFNIALRDQKIFGEGEHFFNPKRFINNNNNKLRDYIQDSIVWSTGNELLIPHCIVVIKLFLTMLNKKNKKLIPYYLGGEELQPFPKSLTDNLIMNGPGTFDVMIGGV